MYDLKAFRLEFKLKQAELANIIGCKQANISGMEKSMRDLDESQIKRLIERYGEASVLKYKISSSPISNNVNKRIEKIINDNFSGSIARFCNKLNLNQAVAITVIEQSKPPYDMLMSILEDEDIKVNMKWLLTGEGEPYQTEESTVEKSQGFKTYLLPMSAMGGSLSGFAEPGVCLQNCEAIVSPIENVDFAITVYGESMSPEYPSGSRILIKKINPDIFIDWGKVYVLDTPNGVVVKEVHASTQEGYISCHSINTAPKFKPFDVPANEIFGMYRVLMCLSAK